MDNKKQQEATLEQMFEMLDKTVERMEKEELSLEETFGLYRQGIDLLKQCNDKIDYVEKKMLILDEKGETHEFEA